ncbi:hypothetical protein GCM10009117_09290 [Gangjinia marincola]|uniref:Uncharacterized protein n=1 Tax=Gangjinia marincola TaxID=578463 RepID=A0ABN1MFD0_9FLAO
MENVEVDYDLMIRSQLNQLIGYGSEDTIYCRFEEDLFCQTNLWFLVYFLQQHAKRNLVYLVRPKPDSPFSFAACNTKELVEAFQRKLEIKDTKTFSELYEYYATQQHEKLLTNAKDLSPDYPFVLPAVEAHLARNLGFNRPGKPQQIIKQLIEENNTQKLNVIFPLFQKEAAIYGFGDL